MRPEEILELGQEKSQSDKEIEETAQKKTEREILLESASSSFSDSFNDWWKQGDYKFSFRADGNYFKIWVSDKLRTEIIELESRSAGCIIGKDGQLHHDEMMKYLMEDVDNPEKINVYIRSMSNVGSKK